MPSMLKVQIHRSLDGFMAGPSNAIDWLLAVDWSPAMKEYINTTVIDSVVRSHSHSRSKFTLRAKLMSVPGSYPARPQSRRRLHPSLAFATGGR